MSCVYESQIADYVDNALEGRARVAFEGHLSGCGECPGIVKDLRAISAAVATLERHAVPPRVWTRIAAAIEPQEPARPWWQRLVIGARASSPGRSAIVLWKPLAAGAFVLVLAVWTWSATWGGWRQFETGETPPALSGLPESVETELSLAAEHYEKAIAGLEQITTSRGGSLDTATSAILRTNLSVIDQAITESRAALTTEPASVPAQESLFEALRSKVALLQDTVALINDMPAGNQDSTASGFNQ